jgi:hypothetical protein
LQCFCLAIKVILESVDTNVDERLWAKIPSFYNGNKFIRIMIFKDHLNIEATAILAHQDQLNDFSITPKGMLKIYLTQSIPKDILRLIFRETLA